MAPHALTGQYLLVAVVIVLLTGLSYSVFPGHTYLVQDSQIYVPILEHLWDPTVLAEDTIAVRHHVTFTIWDELAFAARKLTGSGFEAILKFEHVLHRALGILGIYLIATALGLSSRLALVVAAVYTLGAWVGGPEVLTVEYEPKPRASAIPMLLLAIGFAAHGRYLAAGVAGSIAFLYHPPTVYPFWVVYIAMSFWLARYASKKKSIYGLLPLAVAAVVLFICSRFQAGGPEPQPLFETIDPALEKLQRMRAWYSWVSEWAGEWLGHHLFFWAVSLAAFLRVRRDMPVGLQFFAVGMPLVGILSMPASYLLLDRWKWALMPKFQPMRALLFVTVFMVVLAIAAALKAARSRRLPEASLWAILAFTPIVQSHVLRLLLPNLGDAVARRRVAVTLIVAALAVAAAWFEGRQRSLGWAAWGAALLAPFFLLPSFGGVVAATPPVETPELLELCEWARASTPKDAMFLFPDAGKALYPGTFRSRALRALYVDWKGGGQVNMVKEFGNEWWSRWQTIVPGFRPEYLKKYQEYGINYVVVSLKNRLPDRKPVFGNGSFVVYQLR